MNTNRFGIVVDGTRGIDVEGIINILELPEGLKVTDHPVFRSMDLVKLNVNTKKVLKLISKIKEHQNSMLQAALSGTKQDTTTPEMFSVLSNKDMLAKFIESKYIAIYVTKNIINAHLRICDEIITIKDKHVFVSETKEKGLCSCPACSLKRTITSGNTEEDHIGKYIFGMDTANLPKSNMGNFDLSRLKTENPKDLNLKDLLDAFITIRKITDTNHETLVKETVEKGESRFTKAGVMNTPLNEDGAVQPVTDDTENVCGSNQNKYYFYIGDNKIFEITCTEKEIKNYTVLVDNINQITNLGLFITHSLFDKNKVTKFREDFGSTATVTKRVPTRALMEFTENDVITWDISDHVDEILKKGEKIYKLEYVKNELNKTFVKKCRTELSETSLGTLYASKGLRPRLFFTKEYILNAIKENPKFEDLEFTAFAPYK